MRRSALLLCALLPLASCRRAAATHGGPGAGDAGGTDAGTTGDSTIAPDAPAPTITDGSNDVVVKNGALTVDFSKVAGTYSIACNGTPYVTGAYASVGLGGSIGYVEATSYAAHTFSPAAVTAVHDGFGDGLRIPVENTAPGLPTIEQVFTVYPAHPRYLFAREYVDSTDGSSLASNYMGVLIVDPATGWVSAPAGIDQRLLDAPFDNDEWVRWDSRAFGSADFTGTGYELGALYESHSRAGLVFGSVTHDFWKTGVYYDYDSTNHRLRRLNLWGGVATADASSLPDGATYGGDGTHDVAAHGSQTGARLSSPRMFVGCFADWRDGLEAYGRANAIVAPPRPWSGGSPVGWMSWGAYGAPVTASQIMGASDFLAKNLVTKGFGDGAAVYVDIDAGFEPDAACATAACVVAHIHANGQRAGTYRTPFSYWGSDLTATVPGTSYTYGDVVLRDDSGNPIRRHGAYMLDVTHPGAEHLIQQAMASVTSDGFDLVKLDFLTDGAMEGRHHDPAVHSGMQAYNQAMAYIDTLLPPTVFISESIAPMFPSQYANSRRISTDVVGELNDTLCPTWPHWGSTEYMLNALTFGWWMQGTLYAFDDPDGMALLDFEPASTGVYPGAWAKTRVTASAIAGGMFFDTTDYTSTTGASREEADLTNAAVDGVAAAGQPFRPLDGDVGYVRASDCDGAGDVNAGSQAATVFERLPGDGTLYLAAFDFDSTRAETLTVDLSRAGLSPTATYTVEDLWAGGPTTTCSGSLTLSLAPAGSKLLMLSPTGP